MTIFKYLLFCYAIALTSCSRNDSKIISRWDNGKVKVERIYSDSSNVYTEKEYYENGQLATESRVENSVRNGKSTSYYKDGQVLGTANYNNGKIDGQVLEYHKNGNIMFKGTQSNGELIGNAIHYYDNGKPKVEYLYKDNKRTTVSQWDSSGNKINEAPQ